MQTYQRIKDSGVVWLGNIPTEWNVRNISTALNIQKGKKVNATDEGLPVLDMSYLRNGGVPASYASRDTEKRFLAQEGDLLVLWDGSKAGEFMGAREGIIGSTLALLTFSDNIAPRYLFYLLKTQEKYLQDMTNGMGIPHVDRKVLSSLKIFDIDITKQQQIASFLDDETAKIDKLITKQERLLELLDEKRRATITHAVTRGLDPNVELRETNIPWLNKTPAHWNEIRVKHLVDELEAGTSVNASGSSDDTKVYVLKTSAVYTRRFRAEENKPVLKSELHRVSCPVRKGSVVISRMNTPELVGAAAYVIGDHPGVYLPDRLWQTRYLDESAQDSRYLAYFFSVQGFRDQISLAAEGASSSMQTVSKKKFLNIQMIKPPVDEQHAIANNIESYDQKSDQLKQKIQTQITLLHERRTSLISHAVTGKMKI
jgi:type I restriction enzyme S subunit